ncbi:YebC/PmpR family DNA-binding transcriptional regulator [Candidatus Curtissbacteria bacterium]|nr:YebC/PmpR family DNA-binding transcriptional regulator [Candidatus Curtissbacteria bacterium]
MSGHSKWSTIKRQKGVADVKRGQVFTKLANVITIAVREGGGGDPSSNFKLRLAIDQARAANMPKENIQRAIDRGLGPSTGSGSGQLESVVYEGYGPGKVAVIVEATTDNRNRTSSEIKGVLERAGGSFATPGAVSWMFADEGLVVVAKDGKTYDEIFEAAVDSGAEDVVDSGQHVEIYTKAQELEKIKNSLIEKGLSVQSAELAKKPSTTVSVADSETAKKVLSLMEKLEGLDEVQKVWANFDIPEDLTR